MLDASRGRHAAGDVAGARQATQVARELAETCGATLLADGAVKALVAASGRPRRTRSQGTAALTQAERRIAQQAAQGLSNREIAQALFVTREDGGGSPLRRLPQAWDHLALPAPGGDAPGPAGRWLTFTDEPTRDAPTGRCGGTSGSHRPSGELARACWTSRGRTKARESRASGMPRTGASPPYLLSRPSAFGSIVASDGSLATLGARRGPRFAPANRARRVVEPERWQIEARLPRSAFDTDRCRRQWPWQPRP